MTDGRTDGEVQRVTRPKLFQLMAKPLCSSSSRMRFRRWNLWFPSAGVFAKVLAGRATGTQITFPQPLCWHAPTATSNMLHSIQTDATLTSLPGPPMHINQLTWTTHARKWNPDITSKLFITNLSHQQSVYLLDLRLYFRKEVNELDVGWQHELPCRETAQVELGMKQLELNYWTETSNNKTPQLSLSRFIWSNCGPPKVFRFTRFAGKHQMLPRKPT